MLLSSLQGEYDLLLQKAKAIREENLMLKKDTATLSNELQASQKELEKVTGEYSTLKEESADFISLKSAYDNTKKKLTEHEKKVAVMEKKLGNKNIILFLTGAGVLLIGFIIGFSSKKQRRRSLLS
jgi:SH3 domain protein